jgi:hypothetical protein
MFICYSYCLNDVKQYMAYRQEQQQLDKSAGIKSWVVMVVICLKKYSEHPMVLGSTENKGHAVLNTSPLTGKL